MQYLQHTTDLTGPARHARQIHSTNTVHSLTTTHPSITNLSPKVKTSRLTPGKPAGPVSAYPGGRGRGGRPPGKDYQTHSNGPALFLLPRTQELTTARASTHTWKMRMPRPDADLTHACRDHHFLKDTEYPHRHAF